MGERRRTATLAKETKDIINEARHCFPVLTVFETLARANLKSEKCGRKVCAGRGAHAEREARAERGDRRRAATGETNHVINKTRHRLFVLADFGTRALGRQVPRSGRLRELSASVLSKDCHLP